MKNLTPTQADLISKITAEFSAINKPSNYPYNHFDISAMVELQMTKINESKRADNEYIANRDAYLKCALEMLNMVAVDFDKADILNQVEYCGEEQVYLEAFDDDQTCYRVMTCIVSRDDENGVDSEWSVGGYTRGEYVNTEFSFRDLVDLQSTENIINEIVKNITNNNNK